VKISSNLLEAGGIMRAIIETSGTQVAVEENAKIKIPKLDAEVGKKVDFDKVLLVSAENSPKIGVPYIKGAVVNAEIVGHGRYDKVTAFKFRRRVKYRRKKGHKQDFTEILVKKINA
jgi:large subunit ribosomal protein L21